MNQAYAVTWDMRRTWAMVYQQIDASLRSEGHTQKVTDKRAILATVILKASKVVSFLFPPPPCISFLPVSIDVHPLTSFILTKTVCVARKKWTWKLLACNTQIVFHFILMCIRLVSLHVCLWTTFVSGTCRRQKKMLYSLELIVMSHHLSSGNQTGVCCKSSLALKCWAIFEPPHIAFHLRKRDLLLFIFLYPFLLSFCFWSFT